jgi:hypothetical protein
VTVVGLHRYGKSKAMGPWLGGLLCASSAEAARYYCESTPERRERRGFQTLARDCDLFVRQAALQSIML